MPVSSQSINQKFRPLLPIQAIASGKHPNKVVLQMDGTVGKVERKNG
jgi:hypothetical protein